MTARRVEVLAGVTAGALGIVGWLYALFGPVYTSSEGSHASVVQMSLNLTSATFFVVMLLSIIGVVVGAYLHGKQRWAAGLIVLWFSTALFLVGTVLSGFSVGLFFLPATLAALIASVVGTRSRMGAPPK